MEVMTKDLKVMDATAIAFCRDNDDPDRRVRHVDAGSLRRILEGEHGRHDRPLTVRPCGPMRT